MNDVVIRRGFADVGHGQFHYRHAGAGAPLLLLHASPGSSRQLLSLIEDMADDRRVIAPDTPGNGDSTPLPLDRPEVVDLARATLEFIDSIGLERVDLYGSHTGAAIAGELAILAPERIDRLVLDGISVLTSEELEEVLTHYAKPFSPDLDGAYLIRAFNFLRDQYLFFPWYSRDCAGRRDGGLGRAEDIHAWLVELLKANDTYHLNYHAAFRWDARERLPQITRPTLVFAAENDPLIEATRSVAPLLDDGRFVMLPRGDTADFRIRRAALIRGFLSADRHR
ncbi:hypothetical protein ACFB49_05960 [Sphingomonas sp. DBB INV C78]|uniref:alpha/beta fold hydrolase n=1 Tax=Sphingomonas sp. DBB INV C78 TaxID=3349434 RepID=UPI0036D3D8AB